MLNLNGLHNIIFLIINEDNKELKNNKSGNWYNVWQDRNVSFFSMTDLTRKNLRTFNF